MIIRFEKCKRCNGTGLEPSDLKFFGNKISCLECDGWGEFVIEND